MNWFSRLIKKPETRPLPTPPKPVEKIEATPAPSAGEPPETWVAAICKTADKTLALSWLKEVTGDEWLSAVAKQSRSAEVRLAAALRITRSEALEQVAQASRDKDKRVYRHCADLLRQRRQTEASAQRTEEIANEVRALLATAPLPHTRLLDLKKELAGLAVAVAGDAHAQADVLIEQALTQLRQEADALRDLHTRQNTAAALATECETAVWPWNETLAVWHTRADELRQARAALPDWLATQASARALDASLTAIDRHLARLDADNQRVLAIEALLAAVAPDTPPDADTTAAWAALEQPEDAPARQALEAHWQAIAALAPAVVESEPAPPPPPTPRTVQPRFDQEAVRGLLDTLRLTIEQGHLVDADAALQKIKSALAGHTPHGALATRLHELQAEVETLRGWARWGTGQARDQLIAAAQALLVGEHDVEQLALDINTLRDEWKRLNAHSPAGKGQWESFNGALEQAYLPVAALRAEQAARHAEARAVREALLAEWEAALAAVVWEQTDFKVIEVRRAQIHKQWREAPQAGFRDERALRKRLDALTGNLDQHLEAARKAEHTRREQIVGEAEALSTQTDLRQAMASAKTLQQRWTEAAIPVRLKRGDEQRLWQRFRAACNAVFERRGAERAEQEVHRQERAQFRQMALDHFATSLQNADANTIKQALTQFRADWGDARSSPRDVPDELETRARELQQQAQRRLDELRDAKRRERYELLASKAALAERVETAALAADPLDSIAAEVKQAWDALPSLPGKTEHLLARRLAEAGDITAERLQAGHQVREDLLLDLEMALDLPSPENYEEVRRERQLERLRNRFDATPALATEPQDLLAHWYATPAVPEAAFDQRIAAIVRQLARESAG